MEQLSPHGAPVALLVNPTAGGGRGGGVAGPVLRRLAEAGFEVRTLVGANPDDALRLARTAVTDGMQALLVAGGDGMVHLGLQAVAGTEVPLGIVAAGTGNDVARVLGLPVQDPEAAADALLGGVIRTIDLGRAGGRWFAAVLSAGFDSMVNERANRMRWPKGRSRYNVAIVAELGVFHPLPFRIRLDNRTIETEAMLVAVGNGQSYGGGMRVCPGALLDDGKFQVTVLRRISKLEFLRVFPRVYKGTHVDHPAVDVYEASEVELDAPGVVSYADGERVGTLPVKAVTVPDALRVIVPG